ncbi:MAG: hypothetical protein QW818_00895 [Candidatus Aenigmatarchaeota archaeon]|nr:hypothetical protein [Candidatus Aenigmarchaeota archaeon]
MGKQQKNSHHKYLLPLFVVASSLVFAVLFTIVITPAVVTKFGFEPILILLLVISGITSSMIAILFYLLVKKEIKL